MLKMLMDPMGGIVLTNDGHAILREIDVAHPVAKSMLELCRGQDEEVGDGTTSVIILGTTNKYNSYLIPVSSWRDAGWGCATLGEGRPPYGHHQGLQAGT